VVKSGGFFTAVDTSEVSTDVLLGLTPQLLFEHLPDLPAKLAHLQTPCPFSPSFCSYHDINP